MEELYAVYSNFKLSCYNQWSERQLYSQIAVIAIDDESLAELPEEYPWPRSRTATVIQELNRAHANCIGLGIYYQKHSSHGQDDDATLYETIKQADNVIIMNDMLHYVNHKKEPKWQVSPPIPLLEKSALANGYVHFVKDFYGRAIKSSLFMEEQPDSEDFTSKPRLWHSFELEILKKFLQIEKVHINPNSINLETTQSQLQIPIYENNAVPLNLVNQQKNYQKELSPFPVISFVDILHKRYQPADIKDRIVLIGPTTSETKHNLLTRLNITMPEIMLIANNIGNILNGNIIRPASRTLYHVILLLALLLAIFCSIHLKPTTHFAVLAAVTAIIIVADFILFTTQVDLNICPAIILNIISFIGNTLIKYQIEESEKKEIRHAFSHYVTASVVNEILKDTSKLKLGGERKELTVFFSDIQDFTTISEKMEIERLVYLLNDYLSAMTDSIIFNHRGMLDKYEGDAIMAVFGAPVDATDHSYDACMAALDNFKILNNILYKRWQENNLPLLKIRIGVNTGPMLVGNMGSKTRFDYTVIGDNVNIGSRLEGINKFYGTNILISESTWEHLKGRLFCRFIDNIRLKGKSRPLRIYELLGEPLSITDRQREMVDCYEKGAELLFHRSFSEAANFANKALELSNRQDNPARILLETCQKYMESPPPENFQLIRNFDFK